MCVMSMIMDHFGDKWEAHTNVVYPLPAVSPVTPQEVDEFRKLLDRARDYDRRHNQEMCELEEKRRKLLDLARQLGCEDGVRKALEPAVTS